MKALGPRIGLSAFVILAAPIAASSGEAQPGDHRVSGLVMRYVGRSLVVIETRTSTLTVDYAQAKKAYSMTPVPVGLPMTAYGRYGSGVFAATTILRAKPDAATWLPDE